MDTRTERAHVRRLQLELAAMARSRDLQYSENARLFADRNAARIELDQTHAELADARRLIASLRERNRELADTCQALRNATT